MNAAGPERGRNPRAEIRGPKEGRRPKAECSTCSNLDDSEAAFWAWGDPAPGEDLVLHEVGPARDSRPQEGHERTAAMFLLRMLATAEPTLADEALKLGREAKELNLVFGAIWRK